MSLNSAAIGVKGGYKRYKDGPPVLDNFNMAVEKGTIYGLLGASGCGKTTILSCIVGLKRLDDGNIQVFGSKPGSRESGIPGKTIGYMPQEISLYQSFTIMEILTYFGRIYGMTKSEISARTKFLLNFLGLEESSQILQALSGGQLRRVSLAVALVHEPPLLILDEPTVGVDPLIREKIWDHLRQMVRMKGTTVLITTHYIEETKQADRVGLMRNGRLLTENCPKLLLRQHKTDLLEEIVLKLCKVDSLDSNEGSETFTTVQMSVMSGIVGDIDKDVIGLKYNTRSPEDYTILPRTWQKSMQKNDSLHLGHQITVRLWGHMQKIMALVVRNYITLFRYPLFVIILLLLPAMQVTMLNLVLGKDPKNIPFEVINNEFHASGENCDRHREDVCLGDHISCNFFEEFGQEIKLITSSTKQESLNSVEMGRAWGVLTIPSNFTEHMRNRFLAKNYATNETLDGSTVSIKMDFSDHLKNIFMLKHLYENYFDFIQQTVADCGGDPRTVEVPLKFNAVYGSMNDEVIKFLQPAQIITIMFFLPMSVSLPYIWDKRGGTLDRSLTAGVNFFHVIVSLIISECTLILMELLLMFGVLIFVFGFTCVGSMTLCFVLCFLMGFCTLSFGFLFGTMFDHEVQSSMWVVGVSLTGSVVSGFTWEREGINPIVKAVTGILPTTYPIVSIRSIVNRGWGLTHPQVWPGFAIILGWTVVCCLASWATHRAKR